MKQVVVYPNNTVEIDGHPVLWKREDFRRHAIEEVRISTGLVGACERRNIGQYEYRIFPTQEVPENVVWANARENVLENREGLRTPAVEAGPDRRAPAVKHVQQRRGRWHRYQGTTLILRCTGPCGRELPASEFYKSNIAKFGKISNCKKCWNAYMKARKAVGK